MSVSLTLELFSKVSEQCWTKNSFSHSEKVCDLLSVQSLRSTCFVFNITSKTISCESFGFVFSALVSTCQALSVERNKLLNEYEKLCSLTKNQINFTDMKESETKLCQFILDPTSLNLDVRVSLNDPLLPDFFRLTRDYCFLMDKTRIRLLKVKENNLK